MVAHNIKSDKRSELGNLLREFLEYLEVEKGRSLKTLKNYEFYLNRFIEFTGLVKPFDINLDQVRKFRMYLNRLGLKNNKELKRSTQNYHLIALRAFLKYLAKRNIKTLSAENIELARLSEREVAYLEGGDLDKLLDAPLNEIKNEKPKAKNHLEGVAILRDKAILELLFSTGLRVAELANLKINDINLSREEFSVRGKGSKIRIVFLSNQARYWLKQYLDARKDMLPYLFIRHDRARLERGEAKGDPLTPRSVQRLVSKYAKIAGLTKRVSPHVLRHSYATDLLMNGADLRSIQQMLGHASISTTQIYTHISDKHLRNVFKNFHDRHRKK